MNKFTLKNDIMVKSSSQNVSSHLEDICKSPSDTKNIKKNVLTYSFKIMESWASKDELKTEVSKLFSSIEDNWINLSNVYRNTNIDNTITNLVINYHLSKYKSTTEKSIKDKHFIQVYNLLDRLVIQVVKKENMWIVDEDLHSSWFVWVLKAVEWKFDPLVADFSTYAYMKIRKEIQDAKSLSNTIHYIPSIHNYYYSTYRKVFKEIEWSDNIELNDKIIEKSYEKLSKNNAWVTRKLITDIVNNKLNTHVQLGAWIFNNDGEDSTISLIDNIESEEGVSQLHQSINDSFLRDDLKKFLWNYTDFEKSIIERKFGIDLWGENTYPVYTIKVTRDWVKWEKDMIAIKSCDAIKRVESLWYKVLSSRKEVDNTHRTETYVWSSMKKLRDYFEIKKMTQTTEVALRKNEVKIVSQLTTYLTDIYQAKGVENPNVKVVL